MTNITALREKIAQLANQANHILAEKGDQVWSKEDQAKFDDLTNQIEQARDQVKAIERMRDRAWRRFQQEQHRQETKVIDELARLRFVMPDAWRDDT